MTDKTSPPATEDWMNAQREYWDSWSSAFVKSIESPSLSGSEGDTLWTDNLDNWWQSVSSYLPVDGTGMYERMLGHGKSFALISEHLKHIIQTVKQVNRDQEGWQDELKVRFSELKRELQEGPLDIRNLQDMQNITGLPVDVWQHAMTDTSLFGEDFLDAREGGTWSQVRTKLQTTLDMLLSIPPTGPDREKTERMQRGAKLALENQCAVEAYADAHAVLISDGLDRLCSQVIERGEDGEDFHSLREIYDVWVDCGEDAYAEFVLTEQYADLYGDLANTSMRLKLHMQAELDDALSQVGIPNRKEMDAALKKQHQMRRELAALQFAQGNSQKNAEETRDLQQQLFELQQTVTKLTVQLNARQETLDTPTVAAVTELPAPDGRKTIAQKKIAKKKTTKKQAVKKKVVKKKVTVRKTTEDKT